MVHPLISVIIPTKNGEDTIEKCLAGIAKQTYKNIEVIVIDSGSTDKTVDTVSRFDFVRVLQIEASEFNHGLTRNVGITEAEGELLLMTVQDASPSDDFWIEKMAKHFDDPEVIGVCGQQIVPHDKDKNPHEWFRPYSKPKPRYVQLSQEQLLTPYSLKELHRLCNWDNVNAMYRKSSLLKYPFQKVSFGEDMQWAKEVVLAGNKIVYDPSSRVFHYHHATYDYTYKRSLTVLYYIYKNFGYVRSMKYNFIDYLKVIFRNTKYKADRKWIAFNWKKMRAVNNAYKDTVAHLIIGEDALDTFHEQICGLPPQGKQNI
ncbi:hypothetical protein GCM10027443_13860 [Pontibacter brevis]